MLTLTTIPPNQRWAARWLIAAGVYNLAWGILVVLLPGLLFELAEMTPPRYPQIWQCVGMIVGVYGVGYLVAACDYRRHWPIILVGLLGKVLGPIGFAGALVRGDLPLAFGATILTNDLIWWVPFSMMLWDAARSNGADATDTSVQPDAALDQVKDQHGHTLGELSDARSLLVLLTRHAGCVFCKEAVADLATRRSALESKGYTPVVISMSPPETLAEQARVNGLEGISWLSDPGRLAFRALAIGRGGFWQMLGPIVWWRGLQATLKGHRQGRLAGDGFQMPGAAVIADRQIIRVQHLKTAGSRVDYQTLTAPPYP